MDVDTAQLGIQLGDVDDIDETPENDNGPNWLAAMINAMDIANKKSSFRTSKGKPFLFCSMIDSPNAVWLENASARFLNSQYLCHKFAPELAAAQNEWYGDATGRQEYKAGFETLLQQT